MDAISNATPLVAVINSLTGSASTSTAGNNRSSQATTGTDQSAVSGNWLTSAQQAANQLDSSRETMNQMQNNLVEEKIALIKAQIRILETTGGDPRIVAHQIAQLSRELAMAVSEYSSGSGSAGSLGSVPATVTASPSQTVATTGSSTGIQGFRQEVQSMTVQLKALAEQQKQRLHKSRDHSADQYLDQANSSFTAIESSLARIPSPPLSAASSDSVDLLA